MLNIKEYRDEYLNLDFIDNLLSDEESKNLYDTLIEKVKWKMVS